MKFLYESDSQNKELYSRYLSASGRSYADLIYDDYGKEDKEASRRIEIKFRIKNEKGEKECIIKLLPGESKQVSCSQ